jgi:hypothetical protein
MVGFLISLIIAFLLSITYGTRRPLKSALAFFVVVFLLIWSAGVWILPFGPTWGGVFWMPFLVVGLVIAVLIATLLPDRPPKDEREEKSDAVQEATELSSVGIFFWILVLILITGIVLRFTIIVPPAF